MEYWIQLENHAWDVCPSGKDRMTGLTVEQVLSQGKPPVTLTLKSPVTGHTRSQKMFAPVRDSDGDVADALILRRYTANWAAPDDRKVNPWDINERDPSDNGTMGTIPGPVIECSVGDQVIVHFKNMDMRKQSIFKLTTQAITAKGMAAQMVGGGTMAGMTGAASAQMLASEMPQAARFSVRDQSLLELIGTAIPFPLFQFLPTLQRTHSLHTHGFVFAPQFDGAYPLTPIDPAQPVGTEAALWDGDFKQGDRVPPGGTFTYTWNTLGWPTTQGVWLYHDHSVCDTENVALGAIGIIVIHPPAGDPVADQDVDIRLPQAQQDATNAKLDPAFLPGGSVNGNPISNRCIGLANDAIIGVLPHQLAALATSLVKPEMPPMAMDVAAEGSKKAGKATKASKPQRGVNAEAPRPTLEKQPHVLTVGEFSFELNDKLTAITKFCLPTFRTPPTKALFLQLYHEFANVGMSVNGRKYLGNTPTVVAGPASKMKFGVVGMGSMAHTFHIHGHRWVIPGPSGTGSAALQQGGPQDTAVSQFEDTRLFGPANSFSFTIDENAGGGLHFMRASPPIGEWHMHCHVLAHMMDGMMGSLLIVNGGESAAIPLPSGKPCPTMPINTPAGGGGGTPTPTAHTVNVQYPNFSAPTSPPVKVGDTVTFHNLDGFEHTVVWDTGGAPAIRHQVR